MVLLASACCANVASAQLLNDDRSKTTEQTTTLSVEQQLEELGLTLKTAVMIGLLSDIDAHRVWKAVSAEYRTGSHAVQSKRNTKDNEQSQANPKESMARLEVARPGDLRLMFQPDFEPDDTEAFAQELQLDPTQTVIAREFLLDYASAFQSLSTTVREQIDSFSRLRDADAVAVILRGINASELAGAEERMRLVVEELGVPRMADDASRHSKAGQSLLAWQQRMIEVSRELDARFQKVQLRIDELRADLAGKAVPASITELQSIARQYITQREALHRQTLEALAAIPTAKQRGESDKHLHAAFARTLSARGWSRARLAGESIDLWTAREIVRREGANAARIEEIDSVLCEHAQAILKAIQHRDQAVWNREESGIPLGALQIQGSSAGELNQQHERYLRSYAQAARRELDASITLRDTLLQVVEMCAAHLDEAFPTDSPGAQFREVALGFGFPVETRTTWAETAVERALSLENASVHQHESLEQLRAQVHNELWQPRMDAIRKRIQRDPALARQAIDALLNADQQSFWSEYGPEMWLGINYDRFDGINRRTESALRSILRPDQFEQLPAAPWFDHRLFEKTKSVEGK